MRTQRARRVDRGPAGALDLVAFGEDGDGAAAHNASVCGALLIEGNREQVHPSGNSEVDAVEPHLFPFYRLHSVRLAEEGFDACAVLAVGDSFLEYVVDHAAAFDGV